MYGEYSSLILRDTLAGLAKDLVTGRPAPAPYAYDPSAGVHVTSAGYGNGAASATATAQPGGATRLGHASFSWTSGGANGIDRPVDKPFVTIERKLRGRWARVTDDLGMQLEWSSETTGAYAAAWEVPLTASPGSYRFRITAKRYALTSGRFVVRRGAILTPRAAGNVVQLDYPQPFLLNDWTYRPADASGGTIIFIVDGHRRIVRERTASDFRIPPGASVVIPAGGAHDRYGNTNPRAVQAR
jgi:hypothetical protein